MSEKFEFLRRHPGIEMTDRLIECVKKHPYLYDSRDASYKNIALKNRVWKLIGKDIGETSEVAKTKWKSLRDNYGRYKKEMADPTIQVKKFIRWPWANHLQFLDETMADREKNTKTRSDTPPPQQFLEISLSETELECASRDSDCLDVTPPDTPPLEDTLEDAPRPKRLKRENNMTMDAELDAIDHLFKSYAQTFKTFTKRNQITLKVELAQLFADIEAKEIIELKQV